MVLTHPIPLCVLPTLLAAIPLLSALVIARRRVALFVLLALVTVVLEATVGSYYWSQRVVIDQQYITESTGWWFAPTISRFDLQEIRSISIEAQGPEGELNWIWHVTRGPRDTDSAEALATRLEALMRPESQPSTRPTIPASPPEAANSIPFDPDDVWDLHCAEVMRAMIESGIKIEFEADALPVVER